MRDEATCRESCAPFPPCILCYELRVKINATFPGYLYVTLFITEKVEPVLCYHPSGYYQS